MKIWGNYYDVQGGFKAPLNRAISQEKMILLIKEIYDHRWTVEEELSYQGQVDQMPQFIDFFHQFMHNRYQIQNVAHKATHDIFTSLESSQKTNDVLFSLSKVNF